MGAPDLLAALRNIGLKLTAQGMHIRVEPKSALTDEIRGFIREHKQELLAELQVKTPLPCLTDAGLMAAELAQLVDVVADFNGHSAEERKLALELALANPASAIGCFRNVVAKIGRLRAKGITGCSSPSEWKAWFADRD